MLQDKGIKKIQGLKAEYTPSWVSEENIFSRFKALKLSEGFSEFKEFKPRGYDLKRVLSVWVSMVVSPEKTVHSYLNSPSGEGSAMGKPKRCRSLGHQYKQAKVTCNGGRAQPVLHPSGQNGQVESPADHGYEA